MVEPVKNSTPNGKELAIVRDPLTAHLKIQFTSGGEIPELLSGFYTSYVMAQKQIDRYLATKVKKD